MLPVEVGLRGPSGQCPATYPEDQRPVGPTLLRAALVHSVTVKPPHFQEQRGPRRRERPFTVVPFRAAISLAGRAAQVARVPRDSGCPSVAPVMELFRHVSAWTHLQILAVHWGSSPRCPSCPPAKPRVSCVLREARALRPLVAVRGCPHVTRGRWAVVPSLPPVLCKAHGGPCGGRTCSSRN